MKTRDEANREQNAYERIRTYVDSLTSRLELKKQWLERHPDWGLFAFERDMCEWEKQQDAWIPSGNSTFDPNDLMPSTHDVISAELFEALLLVAVSAYERHEAR